MQSQLDYNTYTYNIVKLKNTKIEKKNKYKKNKRIKILECKLYVRRNGKYNNPPYLTCLKTMTKQYAPLILLQ